MKLHVYALLTVFGSDCLEVNSSSMFLIDIIPVVSNLHCVSKRPTFTTCYNFYIHSSIATIFSTNVAENVGNQNILYFPITPN